MIGVLVIAIIVAMVGMLRYFYLMATERVTPKTRWKELDSFDLWILILTLLSALAVPAVLISALVMKQ